MNRRQFAIPVGRNISEYALIAIWWVALLALWRSGQVGAGAMNLLVVAGCWAKCGFFGVENMRQLLEAARTNLSHHRFLLLMGINMSQMILAFTFDFHLLHTIDPVSFAGLGEQASMAEALFDCFYLITLNFSFFGYSDILPQTVPARIVNLTEIVLAFVTVIFLLSDFISLKDSLRSHRP